MFLAGKDVKSGGETCRPLMGEGDPRVEVGVGREGHVAGGGRRVDWLGGCCEFPLLFFVLSLSL